MSRQLYKESDKRNNELEIQMKNDARKTNEVINQLNDYKKKLKKAKKNQLAMLKKHMDENIRLRVKLEKLKADSKPGPTTSNYSITSSISLSELSDNPVEVMEQHQQAEADEASISLIVTKSESDSEDQEQPTTTGRNSEAETRPQFATPPSGTAE